MAISPQLARGSPRAAPPRNWSWPSGSIRRSAGVWPAVVLRLALLAVCVGVLGWGPGHTGDVTYYASFVELSDSGRYPFFQFWMEYPPLFPLLAVAIYRGLAALQLGGAPAFSYAMLVLLAGADVINLVLVHRLAQRVGGARAAQVAALAYAACPIAIFFSVDWFDALAVLCLLAGLLLIIEQRAASGGVVLALGVLTKLFPGVLLLGAPVVLGWRGLLRLVIACAATLVVVLAPLALARPDLLLATAQSLETRPPWETVPALLQGNYSHGSVPSFDERAVPPPPPPSGREALPHLVIFVPQLLLLLLALAGTIWLVVRCPRPTARDAVVLVTLGLSGFMLGNKGFSPQYLSWLAPLLLLAWPMRTGLVYTVVFSLYFAGYYLVIAPAMGAHALGSISDEQIARLMWTSVLLRSALLGIVIGHLALIVWRRGLQTRLADG